METRYKEVPTSIVVNIFMIKLFGETLAFYV
ncbi:hypothetical protein DOQ08_00604 [Marinobacter litoralis]|uniref:Uncharacterized protein n=1 Tax=Marinobacter litoralis TaxID=187981 RepID=A0A3M2RL10_9GAMM|nr:hypothetical protein DOQ08_00604 [Marinobacter litoralis]